MQKEFQVPLAHLGKSHGPQHRSHLPSGMHAPNNSWHGIASRIGGGSGMKPRVTQFGAPRFKTISWCDGKSSTVDRCLQQITVARGLQPFKGFSARLSTHSLWSIQNEKFFSQPSQFSILKQVPSIHFSYYSLSSLTYQLTPLAPGVLLIPKFPPAPSSGKHFYWRRAGFQ